jgi:acyl-CoA thioesterase-2
VGDLGTDTTITASTTTGQQGAYSATMARDWEIWGPQGGYVASFALRAAGAHCGLPRPASIVGHFLGVASFDEPIDIACTTLRSAKTAHSVHVSITQRDRPIFDALVWGTVTGLQGLEHQYATMPQFPNWSELPTVQERLESIGEKWEPWFPFWANFEQRPPEWRTDWETREPRAQPPEWSQWLRYLPTPSFPDPWLDACRLLIIVDVGSWPSVQAHHNVGNIIAPSIDLACEFHRIDPKAEWLLGFGTSPSSDGGLIATHQSVFADDGRLLASGVSQLLCRPAQGQRG